MARDYAIVSHGFWSGHTGNLIRHESKDALLLGLYLMTCQNSTNIGIFYIPQATIEHETRLEWPDEVEEAMAALQRSEFAFYDAKASVVWIPAMCQYQLRLTAPMKPGDKRIGILRREIEFAKKTKFFGEFVSKYGEFFETVIDLRKGLAVSRSNSGSGSGAIQEQYQSEETYDHPSEWAVDSQGEGEKLPLTPNPHRGNSGKSETANARNQKSSTADQSPADTGGGPVGNADLAVATVHEVGQLSLVTPAQPLTFNVDDVYALYPKKIGRKKGLERLRRTVKTKEQYADLVTAIKNYAEHVRGQDPKYTKHFDSFVSIWEDWVVVEKDPNASGIPGLNRRNVMGRIDRDDLDF